MLIDAINELKKSIKALEKQIGSFYINNSNEPNMEFHCFDKKMFGAIDAPLTWEKRDCWDYPIKVTKKIGKATFFVVLSFGDLKSLACGPCGGTGYEINQESLSALLGDSNAK